MHGGPSRLVTVSGGVVLGEAATLKYGYCPAISCTRLQKPGGMAPKLMTRWPPASDAPPSASLAFWFLLLLWAGAGSVGAGSCFTRRRSRAGAQNDPIENRRFARPWWGAACCGDEAVCTPHVQLSSYIALFRVPRSGGGGQYCYLSRGLI